MAENRRNAWREKKKKHLIGIGGIWCLIGVNGMKIHAWPASPKRARQWRHRR